MAQASVVNQMNARACRETAWLVLHTQRCRLPDKHKDLSCGFDLRPSAWGSLFLPLEQRVTEGSDFPLPLGRLAISGLVGQISGWTFTHSKGLIPQTHVHS